MSTRTDSPVFRPVIGVPLERTISHADKVFFNFIGIAQQGFPFIRLNYGRTDLARNRFAIQILQTDFTHLIMLDLDHAHPYDIVQRLMVNFVRKPDLKVVGGLNYRRGEPYDPCAFLRGDDGKYYPMSDWEEGLIRVDALGTGCVAIAREVFEQIEPPWFFNDYSKVMDDVWPGEDIGFAMKCQQAGIEQWVDTTITSPHLIDALIDGQTFQTYIQSNDIKSAPIKEVVKEYSNE